MMHAVLHQTVAGVRASKAVGLHLRALACKASAAIFNVVLVHLASISSNRVLETKLHRNTSSTVRLRIPYCGHERRCSRRQQCQWLLGDTRLADTTLLIVSEAFTCHAAAETACATRTSKRLKAGVDSSAAAKCSTAPLPAGDSVLATLDVHSMVLGSCSHYFCQQLLAWDSAGEPAEAKESRRRLTLAVPPDDAKAARQVCFITDFAILLFFPSSPQS